MNNQLQSWPHLVGRNGNEVVEIIKKETGFTNVHILQENSPATMDLRSDRVRVVVDKNGTVVQVPVVT